MTLQDKMILYRGKERISQKELAARCGLTVQTINAVENGIQHPSRLTEQKILLVVDAKEEDS